MTRIFRAARGVSRRFIAMGHVFQGDEVYVQPHEGPSGGLAVTVTSENSTRTALITENDGKRLRDWLDARYQ